MDLLDYVDDDDFLENDLEIIDIVQFGFPRRIQNRPDYFDEMDNLTFFQRFRLTKPTVQNVLLLVEERLQYNNDLNNSVSPINQLLTCLRFYASAGHLASIADFMGIHVSTVSRIICRVSNAIATLAPQYIHMPRNEEMIQVQNEFFNIASFPRVIGCIDCTHIRIQSPGGADPEVFRNRKSYFSINTQVVSDSKLKIRDVVARWPGSAHDMTIYMNSRIRARFEVNEFPNCTLLGDGGYANSNNFLTPIGQPLTRGEQLYNESHIRTRNVVERLFGVWKRRFPILAYGLRLKLETVLNIIVATAVLQNVAVDMNEDNPPLPGELNLEELNYLIQMGQIPHIPNPNELNQQRVYNTRNQMINYFNNM